MDAAIFRSNGKNFVDFISTYFSKPVFVAKSGMGQMLDIQVTRSDIRLGPDMEMEYWLGFEAVGGNYLKYFMYIT